MSSALNILGIGQHGDFAIYHHVLNRAQWSPPQLSRVLLLLVAGRLGSSTEPLVFGIDETVERRWGRKIADPTPRAVSGSGAVQGRPGGDDPRIAMQGHTQMVELPDVADAYRMGGSTLGAAVFDRAGGVGPLRPAQRTFAAGTRRSPTTPVAAATPLPNQGFPARFLGRVENSKIKPLFLGNQEPQKSLCNRDVGPRFALAGLPLHRE